MEYLLLLVSCVFFAMQFVTTKLFEQRTAGGLSVCLWNQIVFSIAAALFLFLQSGFCWEMNPTSFLYATAFSVFYIINTVTTILAMSRGKVLVVSTYCLAGGMILPFLYGILFLHEQPGVFQCIGMAVLCASLIPAIMGKSEEKQSGSRLGFFVLCLVVFATNGLLYIALKCHQILPTAVPENSFMLATVFIRLALALLILAVLAAVKRRNGEKEILRRTFWEIGRKPMTGKLFLVLILAAAAGAVCNTVGNLFSLRCMVTMDASLQLPIQNVSIILLTAVFGWLFFKEKLGRNSIIGLLMSVVGIALMVL